MMWTVLRIKGAWILFLVVIVSTALNAFAQQLPRGDQQLMPIKDPAELIGLLQSPMGAATGAMGRHPPRQIRAFSHQEKWRRRTDLT